VNLEWWFGHEGELAGCCYVSFNAHFV